MTASLFGALGLIVGLGLLIWLTVRGLNILVAAPFCAAIVAATSGLGWLPVATGQANFVSAYTNGFTGFFADWFFMFLLGAIFGEVMGASGTAASVARWTIRKFGIRHAVLAVVVACALLTYGGVSVFIVAFSVYGLAVHLFREADLPRRFIPGALAFGSVTFTMTSAGSPEIQNLIPMQYLGTDAYAAWEVSLVVAVLMAGLGYWWLARMVRRAVANGERFEARPGDADMAEAGGTGGAALPNPLLSLLPLVAVLAVFLLCQFPESAPGFLQPLLPARSLGKYALLAALGAGIVIALLVGLARRAEMPAAFSRGATGAIIAITNTCAVVGFGAVAQLSPAFQAAVDAVLAMPGSPLIGAAIAVTVIAGLTGSASGGQTIALPLLAPHYLDMGVNPEALHRVVAISSGALDSLPHNGYVVTTVRAVCGETHRNAYGPVGVLTVIVPAIGTVVALALFALF